MEIIYIILVNMVVILGNLILNQSLLHLYSKILTTHFLFRTMEIGEFQVMYMNYTVTLFPSITLPSQLLYRIIYQNNTYAFWKFANFTFVNSSEFSSIYCIPYQWNFTTQKWTPNTDFQVSQMIVVQTNGISDIWNPETPYNGIFGFNGMTGYAVDLNYSTPQNFIEMPNLVHYLTFNGSALAQMYNIQPGREAAFDR